MYETALALAATVLQGAYILAIHNQDTMLESDLRGFGRHGFKETKVLQYTERYF